MFNTNGKKFKGATRTLKDYDKDGKLRKKEHNYNNNQDSDSNLDSDLDSSSEENNYKSDSSSDYEEFNHIKKR